MIRHCVICGAAFTAPPSSKKITCSAACSTQRKRESHTGVSNHWSDSARATQSKRIKAKGTEQANRALTIAMALPESQRGPQNRGSKVWVLVAPDGERFEVVNLMDWARHHAHWFDVVVDDADRERVARNIHSGFGGIVQTMMGQRKHPVRTYKGWGLGDWPRDKSDQGEKSPEEGTD